MKKLKNENHRNKLDVILTDLQPVETPQIYTMEYFYNYLIERRSIKKISKKKADSEKGISCPSWHAAPLKFHILKDNNELREMSYVNPISMIEVCLFLEEYESILLDQVSKESFSIRFHHRRKDLIFKNANNNKVEYSSTKSIRTQEASGDYYEIGPYRRLDIFYKSTEWFDLNRKYKYFGKIDYSKCFDSIYTHTFNWIIADNTLDAKNFNKKHFLSATDRLLQNMNMSITNGIIVGPEFSRFLAEIIFQSIDYEVMKILRAEGYQFKKSYTVKRYIDDIFIFANREEEIHRIIKCITKVAEKYKLRINDEKKIFGKLPHVWSGWVSNIQEFQRTMTEYIFHPLTDSKYMYLIKEKNVKSQNKVAKIKELFQDVIISDSKMNVKIVSYSLSTFINKLTFQSNDEYKKNIFNIASDKVIYNLLDVIIYIYSFAATFNNTEKLISIIHIIENEIGEEKCTQNLRGVLRRYSYIFENSNLADYANLILLCSMKKIDIGVDSEKKCIEALEEESNPILYAVHLIYEIQSIKENSKSAIRVEEIINEQLEILKNTNDIFLNPRIWWVLIFYNCPHLSSGINSKMKDLLTINLGKMDDKTMWGASKIEVINFYLNESTKQKIINWNLDKDTFYQDIIFKTFDRTLFNNPGLNDEDDIVNY